MLALNDPSSIHEVAMLWTPLPALEGASNRRAADKPWHHAVRQRAVERRARNAARGALGTLWRRVEAVVVTDGH